MPNLVLTKAECQFVARVSGMPEGKRLNYPASRVTWLGAAIGDSKSYGFQLSWRELELLDELLLLTDPRGEKTPDGEPLMTLVEKVWKAMVEIHTETVVEEIEHAEDRDTYLRTPEDQGAAEQTTV